MGLFDSRGRSLPLAVAVLLAGGAVTASATWAMGGRTFGPGIVRGVGPGPGVGGMMGWRGGAATQCGAPAIRDQSVRFAARDSSGMMGGAMMRLMPMRAVIRAGRATIELVNPGSRPHELLVFPLASQAWAGQRAVGAEDRVDEAASLGEVVPVCTQDAAIDGTAPGNVARVALDLRPGRYEVLCNLPGHYRRGMWAVLTVR